MIDLLIRAAMFFSVIEVTFASSDILFDPLNIHKVKRKPGS
jgi:hypothetical protein